MKKKNLLLLAIISFLAVLCLLGVTFAEDTTSGVNIADWTYTTSEGGTVVTLTAYNGTSTDVVIPTNGDFGGDVKKVHITSSVMNATAENVASIVISKNGDKVVADNTNWSHIFYGNSSLIKIDLSRLDTSTVQNMYGMFFCCPSLTSVNLDGLDTSSVTHMEWMFWGCSALTTLDLSSFDTSSVYSMEQMFGYCPSLQSVNLNSFVTDSVTSMKNMFYGCSSLTSLDLGKFDTSSVNTMEGMFNGCSSLTTLNISGFNNKYATNMKSMFSGCKTLKNIVFGTSSIIPASNTENMFSGCSSLEELNLSNFDVSAVSSMNYMFYQCTALENLELNNFNTSAATSMDYMFSGCSSLKGLDLSSFDTAEIQSMKSMFYQCADLENLDLDNFNTSSVTNMSYMFSGCSALTSLNINNFETEAVTNMKYMFSNCAMLEKINLSSFDTSAVTDMSYMFYCCTSLKTIIVIDLWSTEQVSNSDYMFSGCKLLTGGGGTVYNKNYIDKEYARSDQGFDSETPGYFTVLVKEINLNQSSLTLNIGEEFQFIVTILPENVSNKSVTWESDNEAVAVVDQNGVVKGITKGDCVVTCKSVENDDVTSSCTVTVYNPVKSIQLDTANLTLNRAEEYQLEATLSPVDADDPSITWASSNESVATVENGLIKASTTMSGTAVISAYTVIPDIYAECTVSVVNPVQDVSLNTTKETICIGEKLKLQAEISPTDADNQNISWISDADDIAVVENGIVTGKSSGTAHITVITEDGEKKAVCQVTVKKSIEPISGVTVYNNDNWILMNETISGDVYIGPKSVTSMYNISIDGDIYVLGGAKLTGVTANKVYGRSMTSSKTDDVYSYGEVLLGSSNSFKSFYFGPNPVTSIPYRIDEDSIQNSDGYLSLTGATLDIADFYINDTLIDTSNQGTFSVSQLLIGDDDTITLKWNTVFGNTITETYALPEISTEKPVTAIQLNQTAVTLKRGEEIQIDAVISPSNADDPSIIWSSSNESVATVENGLVKASDSWSGTAVITAQTSNPDVSATCEVSVTNPVTGVSLSPSTVTIGVGQTSNLYSSISPYNADNRNLIWTSDAENIVTVQNGSSGNGIITGVGIGTAHITVKTEDGGFEATSEVTVIETESDDSWTYAKLTSTDQLALLSQSSIDSYWFGRHDLPSDISVGSKVVYAYNSENGYYSVTYVKSKDDTPYWGGSGDGFSLSEIQQCIDAGESIYIVYETSESESKKWACVKLVDTDQLALIQDSSIDTDWFADHTPPEDIPLNSTIVYHYYQGGDYYMATFLRDKGSGRYWGLSGEGYNQDGIQQLIDNGTSIYIVYELSDSAYTKGDLNGDGKVSMMDANLAKRIAMKTAAESEYTADGFNAGDLDKNGKITINEARKIKRAVLTGIEL